VPQLPQVPQVPEAPQVPQAITSPLPVGSLPRIPAASPSLSPGGNAATLFPTLAPKPASTPTAGSAVEKARARQVANTAALPEGASVIGGQLIGLAALALAFVLAVVRLSVRRRPAAGQQQAGGDSAGAPPTGPDEKPGDSGQTGDSPR